MKIGIIAHIKHPITAPFAGGLEVFTHQITKMLQERGHDVILFASSSSDPTLPVKPILSDEHYDQKSGFRAKIKDLPSEYISEHHAYFTLMMEIDGYDFDVIFNNSLHYIPITMAGSISTPMLTVLHTPPFYELELAIKAERLRPIVEYVTVSRQSAFNWSRLIHHCPVILNGIEPEKWEYYAKPSADVYVIWFGRIHPDKGVHHAITAARKAGVPLRIAGGIADKRYFEMEIAPLLGPDVTMLGLLDHCSLNREIGLASVCLVTPTWMEPFGLVVAEAMACGTPIAGFAIGSLPELVANGCGILADPGDTNALAEAILLAIKLDRKIIRGHVTDKFALRKTALAYEQLLDHTVNKRFKSAL